MPCVRFSPVFLSQASAGHAGSALHKTADTPARLAFFDASGSEAQLFHLTAEFRRINVQLDGEDLPADLVADLEHAVIVIGRIDPERGMERRTVVIAHIHRGIDRKQEEPHPPLVTAFEQLGIGAQQHGKGLAMAELVVAPFLEPVEDRVELVLRVLRQMAEDRDVARVADLLRQIDRVEDELRLEIRVFLGLRQIAQIHTDARILEAFVDEAGMAAFIAGEQPEQLLHVRVLGALGDLGIEDAAGKFRSERADEEVDEFGAQFRLEAFDRTVEAAVAAEVALVAIL